MIGQTWTLANVMGDRTFIAIEAPGSGQSLPVGCVVLHYTKDKSRAYWQPGSVGAEIRFVICPRSDGSWGASGGLQHGTTEITGTGSSWVSTFNVGDSPSWRPGYLIIPALGNDTATELATEYRLYHLDGIETFESIVSDPHTIWRDVTWRTDAYIQHTCVPYQNWCGNALISEQWEACDIATWTVGSECVHEKWYFAPNLGLVQVEILNVGRGEGVGFCPVESGMQQCYTLQQISIKRIS